jgi:protoporphyrinogen oxidase
VVPEALGALRTLQFQGGAAQPGAGGLLVAIASESFARRNAEAADEVVVRRLVADVERLAPRHVREIQAARVVRWHAGLPSFGVGHYRALERLRRVEAAQLAGGRRLALAGDHLAGPRLEDAVASGLRAADALADAP